MKAGDLDKRVEIQRADRTQNATGEAEPTWRKVSTRWASITPRTGSEIMRADQSVGAVTHVVRMRYGADITHLDRLLYVDKQVVPAQQRILEIGSMINTGEKGVELELLCIEDKTVVNA